MQKMTMQKMTMIFGYLKMKISHKLATIYDSNPIK